MKKIVIPPCVTSREAFNFGQAINFIYADVLAKFYQLKGDEVEFTPFTWNHHARRLEERFPEIKSYEEYSRKTGSLREYMEKSLHRIGIQKSSGRYEDNNSEQNKKTQAALDMLVKNNFASIKNNTVNINIAEIVKKTKVMEYIDQTKFTPPKYKLQLMNALKNNNLFEITQPATFATEPSEKIIAKIGNQKIKPIFNLILSPQHLTPSNATHIVHGSCSLTRYILDGYIISAGLNDKPFSENVLTYPLVYFSEEQGRISQLLRTWEDPNIIRYAALQYVNRNNSTKMEESQFSTGKKIITKLKNLDNFFKTEEINSGQIIPLVDKQLKENKVANAIQTYSATIRQLSKDINQARLDGSMTILKPQFISEYQNIKQTGKIFFV